MPAAYGYARVSHDQSARSGLSEDTQRNLIKRYYETRLASQSVLWGGVYFDPAVSARHVPFLSRKQAAELNSLLKPGDHIIFAHLDRPFRALLDFASVLENVWDPKGINVHFADMQIDLESPAGRAMANMMATFAQWQSDSYSERNKEIAARMRQLNRPTNGTKRLGFKLVGPTGYRQWGPDHAERRIMGQIVRLRDGGKMSWEQISDLVERQVCESEGRQFRKSAFAKRKWTRFRCRRAYLAYKENGFVGGALPPDA